MIELAKNRPPFLVRISSWSHQVKPFSILYYHLHAHRLLSLNTHILLFQQHYSVKNYNDKMNTYSFITQHAIRATLVLLLVYSTTLVGAAPAKLDLSVSKESELIDLRGLNVVHLRVWSVRLHLKVRRYVVMVGIIRSSRCQR